MQDIGMMDAINDIPISLVSIRRFCAAKGTIVYSFNGQTSREDHEFK
jgi:hypothetical protein